MRIGLQREKAVRFFVRMLAVLLTLASASVASASEDRFTPKAFQAAQAAGQSILVRVHASWCPVCKKQGAALRELEENGRLDGVQLFKVDFDTQKSVVKSLGVTNQSTLIVFKRGRETGRLVGGSDPALIATLLDKAL
jgi:thioredoxin 1